MNFLKNFLRNIFTEDDGESYCIAKVMSMIAFLAFIGYAGYGLYLNKSPDLDHFASGLMEVLMGAGTVIAGKTLTQKKDN